MKSEHDRQDRYGKSLYDLTVIVRSYWHRIHMGLWYKEPLRLHGRVCLAPKGYWYCTGDERGRKKDSSHTSDMVKVAPGVCEV